MCRSFSIILVCIATLTMFLVAGVPSKAEVSRLELVDEHALTFCLPRNGGVISGRRLTGGSGFDFRVSEDIASQIGLPLKVIWIENELDEESDPVRETFAMLAYRLCDAVPGHARYEDAVGDPGYGRASLPRWLGMPQEVDTATGLLKDTLAGFVDIEPVSVTAGYMRSEIGLVYHDGTSEPEGLHDLRDRNLAVQQGTLSGTIAAYQVAPIDRHKIVTLNPGAEFLWEVENQSLPLAIVDVPAFDAHRQANPFTPLRLADWRHPLGMDIGIAVLSENEALLDALGDAIQHILAGGNLPAVAESEGLTYAAPKSDQLTPRLTLESLRRAR